MIILPLLSLALLVLEGLREIRANFGTTLQMSRVGVITIIQRGQDQSNCAKGASCIDAVLDGEIHARGGEEVPILKEDMTRRALVAVCGSVCQGFAGL